MTLLPLPAFDDNYIWMLHDGREAVVVDPGDEGPVLAALQAHVRDHLSKHKYPRWIEVVDELPRNDRGKVDKQALIAASAGTPA